MWRRNWRRTKKTDFKASPLCANNNLNTTLTRLRCQGRPLWPNIIKKNKTKQKTFYHNLFMMQICSQIVCFSIKDSTVSTWDGLFNLPPPHFGVAYTTVFMCCCYSLAFNLIWKICPQIWLLSGICPANSKARRAVQTLLLIYLLTQITLAINISPQKADAHQGPSKKNSVKESGNQGHPKKGFVSQEHQTTAWGVLLS